MPRNSKCDSVRCMSRIGKPSSESSSTSASKRSPPLRWVAASTLALSTYGAKIGWLGETAT
eukprot:3702140-Heterocapsa_arctica.AAC.1